MNFTPSNSPLQSYRVHTSYQLCPEASLTPSNSPLPRGRTRVSPLCKGGLRGVSQDFHFQIEICLHGSPCKGGEPEFPGLQMLLANLKIGNIVNSERLLSPPSSQFWGSKNSKSPKIGGFRGLPDVLTMLRNNSPAASLLGGLRGG